MFEIATYCVFRKLQHETMPKGETMMLPRPLQLLSDFFTVVVDGVIVVVVIVVVIVVVCL